MRTRIIFSTLALAAFFANGTVGASDEPVAWDEFASRFCRAHFSRYYMTPLMEKGLVARTNPNNPQAPRKECKPV